jgi:hypothetical protein
MKSCRHRSIPMSEVPAYQAVFRAALHATPENWKGPEWIRKTPAPIAELLDRVEPVSWQQREPRAHVATDQRENKWGYPSPQSRNVRSGDPICDVTTGAQTRWRA